MPVGSLPKFGCCGVAGDVCIAEVTMTVTEGRGVPDYGTDPSNLYDPAFDGFYGYPTTYLTPANVSGLLGKCITDAESLVNVRAGWTPAGANKWFRQYDVTANADLMFNVTSANRYHHITNPTPDPVTDFNPITWTGLLTPVVDEPVANSCNGDPWGSYAWWNATGLIRAGAEHGDEMFALTWNFKAYCQAVKLNNTLVCKFTRAFGWRENGFYTCEDGAMEVVDFKKIKIPTVNFDQFKTPLQLSGPPPLPPIGSGIWTDYGQYQEFYRFMAAEDSGAIFPTVGYNTSEEGYDLESAPGCCNFDPEVQLDPLGFALLDPQGRVIMR